MQVIDGRRRFHSDPAGFIEQAIQEYLSNSPNNHFSAFPEDIIWDRPLVGFADGNDPLFQEYKRIIGDFHVTPREVLEMYIDATARGDKNRLCDVSVISFALPATAKTRASNRAENKICSRRWNYTRFEGQEVVARLSRYLVALIESLGGAAVAPDQARWFELVRAAGGLSSKWSQRHIAYAAGLGTFGLSDSFITPAGSAIRVGSVVCDQAIAPTPRKYANHYANCLFYTRGECRKCAERCPAGAISNRGHDKSSCEAYLQEMRKIVLREGKIEGYIGQAYLGCGLCQTGVPCEDRIPA